VWLARRKTGWLAWGLWLLTMALALAGGVLVLVSPPEARGQEFRGLPDLFLALPFMVGSATVGAMVAARRPGNPVGWLLGICGLLVGLDQLARAYAIHGLFIRPGSLPAAALAAWLTAWTWQLTCGLMITLVPLLFPTGRPPSPGWRPLVWLACGLVAAWTLGAALGPGPIKLDWRAGYTAPNPLGQPGPAGWWLVLAGERVGPPLALAAALGAGALLARLIRARGEERQQLKWVAFAAGVSATGVLLAAAGAWRVGFALVAVGLTALPLVAGLAILRHRLFDIDVIISNAVLYALLTALVAGLYGGVTTLVQRLSLLLAGQQSDATLVVAAIVAAVAFTPAKNHLQAVVDRRFKSGGAREEPPAPAAAVAELSAELARLRAKVDSL
jgi:hypothetical protein